MAWLYTAGTTHTADGINVIKAMLGSANYSAQLRSIINIATDGVPNGNTSANHRAAATSAQTRGIDAMTAEAIGAGLDVGFSRTRVLAGEGVCTNCGVVLPGVGSLSDPATSDPGSCASTPSQTLKMPSPRRSRPSPTSPRARQRGPVAIALLAAGGQARRSRKT